MELESIFKILVVFTIAQRLLELLLANLNEKLLKRDGGVVVKENNYYFMVALHITWLATLAYFAFFKEISFNQTIAMISLAFFLIGQCLRTWAIFSLGRSWSTRIMYKPNGRVINRGIFQYIRHPNYLGVILEVAALPMFASLFLIAAVYSLINFIILYFRIKKEEWVLNKFCNYKDAFNLATIND